MLFWSYRYGGVPPPMPPLSRSRGCALAKTKTKKGSQKKLPLWNHLERINRSTTCALLVPCRSASSESLLSAAIESRMFSCFVSAFGRPLPGRLPPCEILFSIILGFIGTLSGARFINLHNLHLCVRHLVALDLMLLYSRTRNPLLHSMCKKSQGANGLY